MEQFPNKCTSLNVKGVHAVPWDSFQVIMLGGSANNEPKVSWRQSILSK